MNEGAARDKLFKAERKRLTMKQAYKAPDGPLTARMTMYSVEYDETGNRIETFPRIFSVYGNSQSSKTSEASTDAEEEGSEGQVARIRSKLVVQDWEE